MENESSALLSSEQLKLLSEQASRLVQESRDIILKSQRLRAETIALRNALLQRAVAAERHASILAVD